MAPVQERMPTHVRVAQRQWAAEPLRSRLVILRRARHLLASSAAEFAASISPALPRNSADTYAAELLPLLDACRFLEREAPRILRERTLGRSGLPWWLGSLSSRIDRVALGEILIIAPANYALFLPGVQVLQALAAGNAVVWKPGAGGRPVAQLFAATLHQAGLPVHLITITEDTIQAGRDAIAGLITGSPPDKVILTGSFDTGRQILHTLAESAIPCVAELSGCDAVIALPSADLKRLAQALAFGMRLNGSATCIAPRRLFLVGFTSTQRAAALSAIRTTFSQLQSVPVSDAIANRLDTLLRSARREGASTEGGVLLTPTRSAITPVLITNGSPSMEIAQADIFAPVLSVIDLSDVEALPQAFEACPYALTAAIFGSESEARFLAPHIHAGAVLINDLIVPTADPRLPFPARRRSGYGCTRGAEGLLEMTAPRTTVIRRGNTSRHYEPTGPYHVPFFEGMIRLTHGATWRERLAGLRQALTAARNLR